MINVYIDGACKGNPGIGGWGVYIIDENGNRYALKGYEPNTTNNRMEIMACLKGLEYVKEKFPNYAYSFTTDSKYLKDAATVWIKNWYKNGWKTANRMPVKNKDLWMEYLKLKSGISVEWAWVRGHSGNHGNEMADKLANQAIEEASLKE